jgi:hypothetical protein
MKTLFARLSKEPTPLHVVYNIKKDKLSIVSQEKVDYTDVNLSIVFTLSSSLISMLKMLHIPLSESKRLLLRAINKDLSQGKQFDLFSHTYDLIVNEFKFPV